MTAAILIELVWAYVAVALAFVLVTIGLALASADLRPGAVVGIMMIAFVCGLAVWGLTAPHGIP